MSKSHLHRVVIPVEVVYWHRRRCLSSLMPLFFAAVAGSGFNIDHLQPSGTWFDHQDQFSSDSCLQFIRALNFFFFFGLDNFSVTG